MGVVLWLARSLASFILGSLIFSSFMVLLLVNNISGKLFSAELYTETLNEQDAYNRIYDEVLVDGAFKNTTQELLGNIEVISQEDVVGLVRQIVPPEYLKQQAEANIRRASQYMTQETAELDLYFEMAGPLANIKPVLFAYMDARIDETAMAQPDPSADLSEQANDMTLLLNQGMRELAQGRLPQTVPSLRFVPVPLRESLFDLMITDFVGNAGLDPRSRQALNANLADMRLEFVSGDTHGFLKVAARAVATPLMDDALSQIKGSLDSQERLNLISTLANSSAEVTETSLRADTREARDNLVHWLSLAKWISLTILIGGSIVLGLIYLPNLTNVLRRPGITLLLVGVSTYIIGRIIASTLPSRLGDLVDQAAAESPEVPSSLADLATDLVIAFSQKFTDGITGPALALVIIGGSLIVASLLVQHWSRVKGLAGSAARRFSKADQTDSSTVPTL